MSSIQQEYHSEPQFKEVRNLTTVEKVLGNDLENIDFIKLDVQGYELEILKGMTSILNKVEFVLLEVSLIEINIGTPLLFEVIQFMEEKNFKVYDICSAIRRPSDNALWQSDFIFVKKNSKLVASKKY